MLALSQNAGFSFTIQLAVSKEGLGLGLGTGAFLGSLALICVWALAEFSDPV